MGEVMQRAATISECQRYRYSLRRTWAEGKAVVCFIMLNPSTADAEIDDPTIRRCIGFGKAWNFDALEVVNLFALRATKPMALLTASDPVGPENDEAILMAAERSHLIICAWGAELLAVDRAKPIFAMLKRHPLYCVGVTKSCRPKHPLYIRGDQQPVLWRGALL